MSQSENVKEDFGKWVICGNGGDVFVGKPVHRVPAALSLSGDDRVEFVVGKTCRLFPCYRYSTSNLSVPQADSRGQVTGVSMQTIEQVGSPSNAPCDVAVDIIPVWASIYPLTPGLAEHEALKAHIQRLVKMAQDAQIAMRSAAAGIQLAGGRLRQ